MSRYLRRAAYLFWIIYGLHPVTTIIFRNPVEDRMAQILWTVLGRARMMRASDREKGKGSTGGVNIAATGEL